MGISENQVKDYVLLKNETRIIGIANALFFILTILLSFLNSFLKSLDFSKLSQFLQFPVYICKSLSPNLS